ncbi:sensor domain-containing diguanylate cyclase [Billgrantia gudaonensis]|uniref:PAS domain S-box-containing protein/diguanylate cyclase (GGDEF) domain-containing protein n=1 Tax=Billgrantia gudaonensis TaxID=376427 RepID=A0A1G8XS27_9GAMM|nr:sensor domain-containing diguanylate cyclase [Halomonas gudaonensis]SDJ93358.1 PAS domain S-box-containing protein/diguanylate cyclase (GGDEF) domain-containing protein [Halomonas gudaonensis]
MSQLDDASSHALFRSLVERMGDIVWSVRADDLSLEYLSPSAERIFGIPLHAFSDDSALWLARVHPDDRDAVAASHEKLLAQGNVERCYRVVRPNGSHVWLQDSAWTMVGDHGRLIRLFGVAKDVTEQRDAECRMRERLRLLEQLKARTSDAVFIVDVDADGRFRYRESNPAHQHNTGLKSTDIVGRTPHEIVDPAQADWMVAHYRQCVEKGEPIEYEEQLQLPGGLRDWHTLLVPLHDASGRIVEIVGMGRDVTAVRDSERRLWASWQELDRLLEANPAVLYSCRPTPELVPTYISPNLHRMLGYQRSEHLGKAIWLTELVHPEDRDDARQEVERLLREGGAIGLRYRIRHADGHYLWVHGEKRLLHDDRGRPEQVVGAMLDISEQHDMESRLAKLGDQLPGFIYQYRLNAKGEGSFPYASHRSREIYGADPEELRESDARAFHAIHADDLQRVVDTIAESAQTLSPWQCEYRVNPDGHQRWVRGMATPERLEDGSVLWHGFICDITEKKQTQLELQASEQRFRRIAETISDVLCLHNADGDMQYRFVSPSATRVLGHSPDELQGRALFDFVHPGDVARLLDRVHHRYLEGEAEPGIEYRFRHRDGHYLWLHTQVMPVYDHERRLIALQTLSRDVTEQRQALQTLESLAERQHRILEAAGEGIYGVDREGRITFMNTAASRLLGWTLQQTQGKNSHELFHHTRRDGTDYPLAECPIFKAMSHGRQWRVTQDCFWHRSGKIFPVELVASPLIEDGEIAGCVVVFKDITERLEAQHQLERLSTIDELTGAPNRRYFLRRFHEELQRLSRSATTASLLMFDIDHFKRINDRWGHAAGDEVLKRLVAVCRDKLRSQDLLGRLGGEEFAILLPETDIEGAMAFAERLRRACESMRVAVNREMLRVTVSLGMTQLGPEDTPESGLERADKALYEAKRSGRNRSRVAGDDDPDGVMGRTRADL